MSSAMRTIIRSYLQEYFTLNTKCKMYLLLYMLFSVAAGVSFFIALYLKLHLKLAVEAIGHISACFLLGQLLGSWLASNSLDKLNYFYLTALSLFALALSFFAIAFIHEPILLIPMMLIMGISSYFHIISSSFLITNLAGSSHESRARAISLLDVSSNIGIGIGGVLVNYFSTAHSQRMFLVISFLLILTGVIYLCDGKVKFQLSHEAPGMHTKPNRSMYRLSLFFIFMLGLIFAQQRISYALFLNESFGQSGASSIFLLNSLIIICCLPNVTRFAIKCNKIIMMGLGGVLLGLGMCMLQFAYLFSAVVFICVVITLGEMLGMTLSQLVCFESAEKTNRGKALSYYKFLYALGTIFGTSIGGYIQGNMGMRYIWLLCGCIGITLLLVSLNYARFPLSKEAVLTSS